MNLSALEKIMYGVMKAIYDSGIPISFKGSMVLKACLLEAGYAEETRHTVDIDGNWNSDVEPTSEQMVESLQNAIDKSGVNLEVHLYRAHGEKRSAGFELIDRSSEEPLFTMDVDVNRPAPATKIYEIDGIRFCGAAPVQIIADKLSAISTDKVFRRIKDVVDLYYISKVFEFNAADVRRTLKNSERELDNFDGFLHKAKDLEHAYEKFRFAGDVEKPPFEEIYKSVKIFIKDVLPREKKRELER
ncbi:MAG: nucleotidyl transferase AbiEii/AbiGii toxin family protein [Oscillospiraceae bacterium]|nr:nucleotidyl transferase AbiEii/AbiGii toxin family protein [Oscillospiraceae bacterium]